jgi:hypothetical protein
VPAAVALLVAATGLVLARSTPDPYARIHTIAVASALGQIPMRTSGFTFGERRGMVPLGWEVDDFVTTLVADALKYRFRVLRVPSEPGAAREIVTDPSISPFDWLQARLRDKPLPQNADAYVIVYPVTVQLDDSKWEGLALTHSGGLFGRAWTMVSAAYAIGIYDAQTGDRMDERTADLPKMNPPSAHLAMEACDNAIWASRPDRLTVTQRLQIHDGFRDLIAKSLPAALHDARLLAGGHGRIQIDYFGERPLACHPRPPMAANG